MAKSTNGLGQFRGKLGGAVFAVNAGEQIVRQYQPQVANPRTAAQLTQRAKMNLTGKLSAIVGNSAIMALGINSRERRSVFTSNILRNATVTMNGAKHTAAIAPEDIIFSKGSARPIVSITVTQSGTNFNITVEKLSNVSEERYAHSGVKYVILVVSNETGEYSFSTTGILNLPAYNATDPVINGFEFASYTNHTFLFYAIPFELHSGYSISKLNNGDLIIINNQIQTNTSVGESVAISEYGKSRYIQATSNTAQD